MKIKVISLLLSSIINLSANVAVAQSKLPAASTPQPKNQVLEQVQNSQQSQQIEKRVQEEASRTLIELLEPTINLINFNLGIINFWLIAIPLIGAGGFFIFRAAIIRKLEKDTREKIKEEIDTIQKGIRESIESQINANKAEIDRLIQENKMKINEAEITMHEITARIEQLKLQIAKNIDEQRDFVEKQIAKQKEYVNDFTNDIKIKIAETFTETLKKTQEAKDEMEREKDRILQELSKLAPPLSSIPDTHQPDVQKQIQALITQLEDLKLKNPQLFLTTDDYLKQGDAFFFEGNYREAIRSYDEVIKGQEDSFLAWSSRGWALRRMGKFEEALQSYEKATQIDPNNHIGWYGLGNVLRELERFDEAITVYHKSLEIKPDFFWSWFRLGRCYMLKSDPKKALESFQKAKELDAERFQKIIHSKEEFHSLQEQEYFRTLFENGTEEK